MWMLFIRAPPPDAAYWPGRRWLAALDAVVWPIVWVAVVAHVPMKTGSVGAAIVAWAVSATMRRFRRALWNNHRYRFTTWRWGRVLAALLLIGWVMKGTLAR